jgi:dTDP-4-dehydrorhamnose reductase
MDGEARRRLLDHVQPEVIINCAAWSWVDGCEQDPAKARRLNTELPHRLAQEAATLGSRLIHFSSSYVFDGQAGPYSETAPPNPISVYGQTKLEGEQRVLDTLQEAACVVRTMGVYGEEPQGKNFVAQVRRTLSEGRRMTIPEDQHGNATYAGDLATGVRLLASRSMSGIWHLAGPEPTLSRATFARRIAQEYDLDVDLLDFVSTDTLRQPARRPLQAGLLIDQARAELGWEPQPWVHVP